MKLLNATVIGLMTATTGFVLPANITLAQATTTKTAKQPAKKKEKKIDPKSRAQVHYGQRVESFKDQNLVYQNVVLLGDSITEAFDVSKYLPGRRVLNRGIGSDVIGNALPKEDRRGVLKRLDESVFNCSPTDVFIMIGINDLAQDHSPETVAAGYREMLTAIREQRPHLKLHLQSVLPTRGKLTRLNPNIVETNRHIQDLAREFNCDYIDLHSEFLDDNGEMKAELTTDGVHLKEAAYHIWRKIVKDKMDWQ